MNLSRKQIQQEILKSGNEELIRKKSQMDILVVILIVSRMIASIIIIITSTVKIEDTCIQLFSLALIFLFANYLYSSRKITYLLFFGGILTLFNVFSKQYFTYAYYYNRPSLYIMAIVLFMVGTIQSVSMGYIAFQKEFQIYYDFMAQVHHAYEKSAAGNSGKLYGSYRQYTQSVYTKNNTIKENPYAGLRQQALGMSPENAGFAMDNKDTVYAAVVDMPINGTIVTMACFYDNTVSLYYSNGGGLFGVGQKYEEVSKASYSLLTSTKLILSHLEKADNYDLPDNQHSSIAYLLTGNGIYKAILDMEYIQQAEPYLQYLNSLIQNVLSKIRESGAF